MPHQDFFTDSRPDDNRTKVSHLTMYRGDTLSFKLFLRADGCPVDITGGTFWFTAKDDYNDPDSIAIITKMSGSGITTLNAPLGQLLIVLDPIDTDGLNLEESTTLYWDLQYQDRFGTVQTIFIGKLTILQEVTRAEGFNIGGFITFFTMVVNIGGFVAGVNPVQDGGFFLNERQQIKVDGAVGGTFTLTVEDPNNIGTFETTTPIAYNASDLTIQSVLETDISFIDDVLVFGSPFLSAGPITVEFIGPAVKLTNIPLMSMDVSSLV